MSVDGRGSWRRVTDQPTEGPGAAPGDDRRPRPRQRVASEWPPFAFYTAKIHLISRWWTDGRTDDGAEGAAPRKACVAATPGRNGPIHPYLRRPRPRPEHRQMGGKNAILGSCYDDGDDEQPATRKGICNCGTYSRCNLNCPSFLIRRAIPCFVLRENGGQRS